MKLGYLALESIGLGRTDLVENFWCTALFVVTCYLTLDVPRPALFRVITQRVVATSYRRFGTTCLSHLQETRIPKERWDPIGYPETSARNYHYMLRNDTEGRISDLLSGGSVMSSTEGCVLEQKNRRCIERGVSEEPSCGLDWELYC
jgi:hypothetical protein